MKTNLLAFSAALLTLSAAGQFSEGALPITAAEFKPVADKGYTTCTITMQWEGSEEGPVENGKITFSMGLPVYYKYAEVVAPVEVEETFVWNEWNRLESTRIASNTGDGEYGTEETYEYEDGILDQTISSFFGTDDLPWIAKKFSYDQNGRCTGYATFNVPETEEEIVFEDTQTQLEYNAAGQVVKSSYSTLNMETMEYDVVSVTTYTYDKKGFLTTASSVMPEDNSEIDTVTFKRDANGLILEKKVSSLAFGNVTFFYTYSK
jgi:hypothetical protein